MADSGWWVVVIYPVKLWFCSGGVEYPYTPCMEHESQHLPWKSSSHVGKYTIIYHTWRIWDMNRGISLPHLRQVNASPSTRASAASATPLARQIIATTRAVVMANLIRRSYVATSQGTMVFTRKSSPFVAELFRWVKYDNSIIYPFHCLDGSETIASMVVDWNHPINMVVVAVYGRVALRFWSILKPTRFLCCRNLGSLTSWRKWLNHIEPQHPLKVYKLHLKQPTNDTYKKKARIQ